MIEYVIESNKNTLRVLVWVARRYWVATIAALIMLVFEHLGMIYPPGAGGMFAFGWFVMYMSVAYSIDIRCKAVLYKNYVSDNEIREN